MAGGEHPESATTTRKFKIMNKLRIGIDVGGTNTDAVLMHQETVLASAKSQTTADVTSGAVSAIQAVLDESGTQPNQISNIMVGTTHFVNAFVQRRDLSEVGIIRIGLPMTSGIPPMVDWPEELRAQIGHHVFMVGGGSYYTGVDYAPLDKTALQSAAIQIRDLGLQSVAISGVFSPIRPDLEEAAEAIVRETNGDIHVTCSHRVGGVGLIERENATIINAALCKLATQVVRALEEALRSVRIDASLYFTQNDGTLMSTEAAIKYPVMTCCAGPTNSIRGAAFLTGLEDAIVVDVGGTTTDVGVLLKGFARETIDAVEMGGVRTNFSMPDVLSIALGGGTIVHSTSEGDMTLGPESVGYQLIEKSICCGGDILTLTDVGVARGLLDLGDKSRLESVDNSRIEAAARLANEKLEMTVDQLKTSAKPVPVVLVGGGSVLLDNRLQGASQVLRPDHSAVANAIGAAISQVGGRIKKIFDFGMEGGRDAALELAIQEARDEAIAAGAVPESIQVLDIEEYPMTHMKTSAVDVRVRVVGDLNTDMEQARADR